MSTGSTKLSVKPEYSTQIPGWLGRKWSAGADGVRDDTERDDTEGDDTEGDDTEGDDTEGDDAGADGCGMTRGAG